MEVSNVPVVVLVLVLDVELVLELVVVLVPVAEVVAVPVPVVVVACCFLASTVSNNSPKTMTMMCLNVSICKVSLSAGLRQTQLYIYPANLLCM